MNNDQALEELARAAAAAGYAMAGDDDAPGKISADSAARGVPTARAVISALAPSERDRGRHTHAESSRGFIVGANTVRDTVYGYLRLGATA